LRPTARLFTTKESDAPNHDLPAPRLAISLTLAACGGSSYSAGSSSKSNAAATTAVSSSGAVVKTAANSTLGATVLTDASGMTLYRLSGEQAGRFICTGAGCLQIWHPLTAPANGTPSGVPSLGRSSARRRRAGDLQGNAAVHVRLRPAAGRRKGQGLKDVGTWNAVTVSAATSGATPAASTKSTPAKTSGGYRY